MLACVESTWHLSISFPGCNIINKLNKLLLTALANLKPYLIDLFQVYSVLQSCRETTTYHCQPVISGPDAVCSISRAISRACLQSSQSDQKLMAACSHGWRGSRKAEGHLAVLPSMETTSKGRKRFGFFQSMLHSLGEVGKYSLLRIITLANLFLQLYLVSYSNQVDLRQSNSKLFRTFSCKSHQLDITCLWQTQQESAEGVSPGVCLLKYTRVVGILRTDDWC